MATPSREARQTRRVWASMAISVAGIRTLAEYQRLADNIWPAARFLDGSGLKIMPVYLSGACTSSMAAPRSYAALWTGVPLPARCIRSRGIPSRRCREGRQSNTVRRSRDAAQSQTGSKALAGDQSGARRRQRPCAPGMTPGGEDRRQQSRIGRSAPAMRAAECAATVMIQCGLAARQWAASFMRASGRCSPSRADAAASLGSSAASKIRRDAVRQRPPAPGASASRDRTTTRLPPAKSAPPLPNRSGGRRSSAPGMPGVEAGGVLARFSADMSIPENLADILARIDAARKAAIAPAPQTSLVAVSKTWTRRASARPGRQRPAPVRREPGAGSASQISRPER